MQHVCPLLRCPLRFLVWLPYQLTLRHSFWLCVHGTIVASEVRGAPLVKMHRPPCLRPAGIRRLLLRRPRGPLFHGIGIACGAKAAVLDSNTVVRFSASVAKTKFSWLDMRHVRVESLGW